MKSILFLLFTLLIFSCSSKPVKQIKYPEYIEVRTKSFDNDIVSMEALDRDDVVCFETSKKSKVVSPSCKSSDGNMLFVDRKEALKYSQDLARGLCDRDIKPLSAEVSREIAGKRTQICKGESFSHGSYGSRLFGSPSYNTNSNTQWIERCDGGEDIYYKKIIMKYKCVSTDEKE